MTAYTLTANATLRDIGNAGVWGVTTARSGADTISTNGFSFIQDQDSRYGKSGTTSTTWGSLTILATKGGELNFDGRYIRMIPFTGGSSTLTLGADITVGSATAATIGIYADLVTAPVATAASGWLKVTAWNGVAFPESGTFTQAGFTFTITGPSIVGFMEVNGDDNASIVANRLGTFNVTGEWFSLGSTSGVSNQTLQIPNNGGLRYVSGVFIEKTAGLKDYEFYPNAGTGTAIGTEAERGKVVWIDTTGLVRIGNSGAATSGYTPDAGLEVVIGNIFFQCNLTTARTVNVIPHATIATRYDFTTTGGGVLRIDKCDMAWYLSCAQAYSVTLSNSGFMEAISLSEVASPMAITSVGVGCKPTTALSIAPLIMTYCYAGGTITDCVWTRVVYASTGVTNLTLTDIDGFVFTNNTMRYSTIKASSTGHSVTATRANNCLFLSPKVIQGDFYLTTCNNFHTTDASYIENVAGNTLTTFPGSVWTVTANSVNCTFSGLTFPLENVHPYTSLLAASVGCSNIKLRNIGTRANPLNFGTANACGLIYSLATNCQNFKFQRIYVTNTRTGIATGDNSCKNITEENVWGDYADAVGVMPMLNYTVKGMGGTGLLTAQTSVYGAHFRDGFTSTTAGRIAIFMNEPTIETAAQVTLTGGAGFTSGGGLYMPVIGMSATFEIPDYLIGHTGFANTAAVMAGGTATNYTYNFSIDKHDGAGWSDLTTNNYTATTLGAALNALGDLGAESGFKLRLKVTTSSANTTAITSLYLTTTSTLTAQDYQYPLDVNTITFTGLPTGTDVVVLAAGTETVLASVDSNPTSFWSWTYSGAQTVDVGFIKPGYKLQYLRALALGTTDASLPVSLTFDRSYGA